MSTADESGDRFVAEPLPRSDELCAGALLPRPSGSRSADCYTSARQRALARAAWLWLMHYAAKR